MRFRIIALSFLMVAVGFMAFYGCGPLAQERIINEEPIIKPYCPESTFTVYETPKQVDSLGIKRVIVERDTKGSKGSNLLFSAIIISPDKKLVVGEKVELLEISYRHNAIGNRQSFLLIK